MPVMHLKVNSMKSAFAKCVLGLCAVAAIVVSAGTSYAQLQFNDIEVIDGVNGFYSQLPPSQRTIQPSARRQPHDLIQNESFQGEMYNDHLHSNNFDVFDAPGSNNYCGEDLWTGYGQGPGHNPGMNDACRIMPGTLTLFAGVDGSKQPQDFGVNANLGGLVQINYAAPIRPGSTLGFQIGSSASFTGNAVQVYELLGESTERFQTFNTVGVFQRFPIGFSWGAVYDFLYQDSFDDFYLGQWRIRASFDIGQRSEVGATFNLASRGDTGFFNATRVGLDPIDQFRIYFRRYWQSGVNSAVWVGIADEHSEENAVTGTLPEKNDTILFGADLTAPLNDFMAIYGETNLMMPADTGAVDAFLGIQFSPHGIRQVSGRQNPYRAMLPVAASPSFTTNLERR